MQVSEGGFLSGDDGGGDDRDVVQFRTVHGVAPAGAQSEPVREEIEEGDDPGAGGAGAGGGGVGEVLEAVLLQEGCPYSGLGPPGCHA